MTSLIVIASLLIAAPALAQTKVYTNADLGQPVSPTRVMATPAQLASLAAHQFRVPVRYDGPAFLSSGLRPTMGPFADYQTTALERRRLDGSLWSDTPWVHVAYTPGFYPPYAPTPYAPSATRSHGPRSHQGGRSSDRRADQRARRTR